MGFGVQGSIRQIVESRSRFSRCLACERVRPSSATAYARRNHNRRGMVYIYCSLAAPFSPRVFLNSTCPALLMGASRSLQRVKVLLIETVITDENHQLKPPIAGHCILSTLGGPRTRSSWGGEEGRGGGSSRDQVLNDVNFRESLLFQVNHTALQRHERQLYLLRKLFHLAAIRHTRRSATINVFQQTLP